ncbi:MAG TPA: hypothetical protein VI818_06795 [Candidatus Thermoplasmatota archaeon]|nr:hypothetical protein [Candidatus Thermoplasmatota archaeon]
MRFAFVACSILVVALALAGCTDGRGNRLKDAGEVPCPDAGNATATCPPEAKAAKEMYVVATDFSTPSSENFYRYSYKSNQFKQGDLINITIKNGVGNRDVHNLVLPDFNVRLTGVKDLTASQEFNATNAGSFVFYCDKMYAPGVAHRARFEGRLVIS